MGYDSHILQDANHPTFEFKHGYPDFLESWKLPQNPTTWIANSCVWYSQVLTKKLGIKKLAHYIKLFDYGNQDLSGDKGKNNGLTQAWLSSSLAISPQDQGVFLEKLCADHLPVSHDAIKKTKAILFVDNLDKGWKLYGKTGMGTQRDAEGNKTELQHGWFIGWIEKKHRKIVCVYHIVDAQKELDYAGRRAKKLATKHMRHIINDIESKEKAVPTP
jgi:beta-lactamase class D